MAEGYCFKCKEKKEIAGAVGEIMQKGRTAIRGKCPDCNSLMFKILAGRSAVASGNPPPTHPPPPHYL
jgi:Zn finger protein HypA/HybF involved in hydrogenase expression